ncbi:hypothetical protein WI78_17415 [Burkholderia ubonensis]|nr:hypothetical protein WI78_17415 [Burkholderia ubonensis]
MSAERPMTTLPALLSDLQARGIALTLVDGELSFRAPKGALTAADRAALSARRDAIVAYLAAKAARRLDPVSIAPSATLRPSLLQELWWHWYGLPPRQLDQERLPLVKLFQGVPAARVADALRGIVARHHTLRSSFHEEDGRLALTLNDADALPIEFAEADGSRPPAELEAELKAQAAEYASRQLPLDGPWLLRARIVSLAPDVSLVLCVFHHIIVDAASLLLILSELDARLADPPRALPSAAQFIDYAAWEREWMADAARKPLIDYWARRFRELPELAGPVTGRSLAWQPGTKVDYKFVIPAAQLRRIQAAATRLRTSLFSALVTAFGIALARWSGSERVPVRCVGDLRTSPELAHIVGYLVCSDVIEIDAPAGADFVSILKATEIESHSAMMLRVPTLMRHPLHAGGSGIEDPRGIAATINMFSVRIPGAGAPADDTADPPWPPPLARTAGEPWPIPLPSVYLRLIDYGHALEGSLELNDTLLTAAEQAALIDALFDALDRFLLQPAAPAAVPLTMETS